MQEETEPEQDIILVWDSLISGQDYQFCKGKLNRKQLPWSQDITERVDHLVENSKQDTLFVTVVGTNNLHREPATGIVEKYLDIMETEGSSVWHHSPI